VSENVLLTPAAPAISPPFPLGVFCQNKSKETLFTISFPEDVELVNSSIFEIEGKGEPWRTYNLGEIAGGKKTSLGSFEFAFKGNTFFYNLKFLPPDSAMSKNVGRDRTQFVQGAVGYSKYDMHGGVSNTSDSRALVSVSVPYYPVFKGVGMGGGLELSLPISKKEGNISHYEMSGYGIYSFEISPMFELRPKLGYLKLNFENESTGEGISGGQLAVGLMSEIFLDNGLAFTLDLTTLKLLSKVFKSHFSVNVKVVKNTKSSLGYGAGIKYQSFKGPASNGSDLNMSQLVLQGIVLF
jgi:hypothetical protein